MTARPTCRSVRTLAFGLASLAVGASAIAQTAPSPTRELSPDEAKALGSKPLGSVSGHYSVRPTGVYTEIDTTKGGPLLDALNAPPSKAKDDLIKTIKSNSGDYPPIILMRLGLIEWEDGKKDDGDFWFQAGLLRTLLDSKLCIDPSVAGTASELLHKSPSTLIYAVFSSGPRSDAVVRKVVAWDANTPMTYDHRWIALHGALATASALNPSSAPTSLTIPASEWPKVIAENRAAYPILVARTAAHIAGADSKSAGGSGAEAR